MCIFVKTCRLNRHHYTERLLNIDTEAAFEALALELFHYQRENNPVYAKFLTHLPHRLSKVQEFAQIPFLPIETFKQHKVVTGNFEPEVIFTSSGTTGDQVSRHFVREKDWYTKVYLEIFRRFYGAKAPDGFTILALLPGYLERNGSSLIEMTAGLIRACGDPDAGFFLNDFERLESLLRKKKTENRKVILLGVTHALLDFAESNGFAFPELIIMETGGMKGKRKEITRDEVHRQLKAAFMVDQVHSEYGMTELLSQAYSKGDGQFSSPPWMRILLRATDDPFARVTIGRTGGVNIIDLANVDSCAFLATSDLGRIHADGSFEILGRFDASDVRGCNLLVQE